MKKVPFLLFQSRRNGSIYMYYFPFVTYLATRLASADDIRVFDVIPGNIDFQRLLLKLSGAYKPWHLSQLSI